MQLEGEPCIVEMVRVGFGEQLLMFLRADGVGKLKNQLESVKKGLQAEACSPLIFLLILRGG